MSTSSPVVLESTLTCPVCGHQRTERVPEDACQWLYECRGCGALLKPNIGDCCVFCSFGDRPCPPIQREGPSAACCGPPRRINRIAEQPCAIDGAQRTANPSPH